MRRRWALAALLLLAAALLLLLAVVRAAPPRYAYVRDALPARDFDELRELCAALATAPETSQPIAFGRRVARLPPAGVDVLRRLGLGEPRLAEYRVYPPGAGMHWHRDTVLSSPPQTELVLTLRGSDAATCFDNGECLRSEPNSLLAVRAGGARHAVVPGTRTRAIVKFAVAA